MGTSLAIVLVLAISISALYMTVSRTEACYQVSGAIAFRLLIRDQDEGYGSSVSDTWVACDMKPGELLPFEGSFAQLKQQAAIPGRCIQIALAYNLQQDSQMHVTADAMAKELIITRIEYYGSSWRINLLTGNASGNPPRPSGYRAGDWTIRDTDGDGKASFFDLRNSDLSNLPAPVAALCNLGTTRMIMSVKFSEAAGNEFMATQLNFKMSYTLR